jgi:hypothetical protein
MREAKLLKKDYIISSLSLILCPFHEEKILASLMVMDFLEVKNRLRYRVHEFRLKMTRDRVDLERFLNELEGEVVSIVPNVNSDNPGMFSYVDFLFIIEKLK